jgi:hypothetical protein
MQSEEYLQNAKAIILKVLSGDVTPETDRAMFQDDIVGFSVHKAQTSDIAWLLTELASPRNNLDGKRLVVQLMTMGPERTRAEAMLA